MTDNQIFALAPMVEGSDYSFRHLVSKFNVNTFFTPMYNVNIILGKVDFLKQVENTLQHEDLNVVFQLAGRDPQQFEDCVKYFKHYKCISRFDINLGCSQDIARRAGYGSYLDDITIIEEICKRFKQQNVKFSAKCRIVNDIGETEQFIKKLISFGCCGITLHCRLAKYAMGGYESECFMQEGFELLLKLKSEFPNVIFIYNGGIFNYQQINAIQGQNIGVMCGQNILANPLIFVDLNSKMYQNCIRIIENSYRGMELDDDIKEFLKDDFFDEIDIHYQYLQLLGENDSYKAISQATTNTILKENKNPILFQPVDQKIVQLKSFSLFIGNLENAINNNYEYTLSSLIMHFMALTGRDLLRFNADIIDIAAGKKHRAKPRFKGVKGCSEWLRFKIECCKICIVVLVKRLESGKGTVRPTKKEDEN